MKLIKIRNKELYVMVDDEDFERINQFKWYLDGNGHQISRRIYSRKYTTYDSGYTVTQRVCNRFFIANEVMQNHGVMYDHKDRIWLNNQKENLRICNSSQNNANKELKCSSKQKYKGVYRIKGCYNYSFVCAKEGRVIRGHGFKTEEEAALAYNKMAKELHGEFAYQNIITYDPLRKTT